MNNERESSWERPLQIKPVEKEYNLWFKAVGRLLNDESSLRQQNLGPWVGEIHQI